MGGGGERGNCPSLKKFNRAMPLNILQKYVFENYYQKGIVVL
jgi:hypothetical protein